MLFRNGVEKQKVGGFYGGKRGGLSCKKKSRVKCWRRIELDSLKFFEIKINVAVLHATSIERLLHLNTTSICQNGIFVPTLDAGYTNQVAWNLV